MSLDFTNKVALVSGSSSGIGQAIAIEFAKFGAKVVITGRNVDKLKSVENKCEEVSTAKGKSVLVIVADITKDGDMENLISATIQEFGQLDILVNNAGVGQMATVADPTAISVYDNIMNINLRSTVVLTHLAIPYLVKTRGNIINISGISGTKPYPTFSSCCMSNAALDMFTQVLALEVGPQGIRVNCVKPGLIENTNYQSAMGLSQEVNSTFKQIYANAAPLRRNGTAKDIADLVLFLASSKAVNMTGALIISDSGVMWSSAQDFNTIL